MMKLQMSARANFQFASRYFSVWLTKYVAKDWWECPEGLHGSEIKIISDRMGGWGDHKGI